MYRAFTLPTPETLEFLQHWFSSVDVGINWDVLGVELGSSHAPIEKASPDVVYKAIPGSMNMWYDAATARSWIIMPLFASPKMVRRANSIGNVWDRPFIGYMAMSDSFNNRRRTKGLLNSISTALVDRSPVLTFHGEVHTEDFSLKSPPFQEFYLDWKNKGGMSNLVFLEEDEGIQ
jgi:hypothetical protein